MAKTVSDDIRRLYGERLAQEGDALFSRIEEDCLEYGLCAACQKLMDAGWNKHGEAAFYGVDYYGFDEMDEEIA